jgi:hypothetical protein
VLRLMPADIKLAVQRFVVARRIGLAILVVLKGRWWCLMIIRFRFGTNRRMTLQRMHRVRIFQRRLLKRRPLLWDFVPGGALHPGRRTGDGAIIRLRGALILVARVGARRDLLIGPAHGAKWISLTDQPSEFRQRIAFTPGRRVVLAAIIVVNGGKRSVLISISHRDDASLRESCQPAP